MIEFDVVLFDVMNICMLIWCDGDEYVVSGIKWWLIGVMDLCVEIFIVMG